MPEFISSAIARAKRDKKTIALPEVRDGRVIGAANLVAEQNMVTPLLIGTRQEFDRVSYIHPAVEIFVIDEDPLMHSLTTRLAELRRHAGLSFEQAQYLLKNPLYVGTFLVREGIAHGMVAGASHSTSHVLTPALQILRSNGKKQIISAYYVIEILQRTLIFADAALHENPDAKELAEIAVLSAQSWRSLMDTEPRVALLSHSTYGSDDTDIAKKMRTAARMARDLDTSLKVDGELQLDAALDQEAALRKAPESQVAGQANVLIFPNLDAADIGYKLMQYAAGAAAYGPLIQGLSAPITDIAAGATERDIIGAIALCSVQPRK